MRRFEKPTIRDVAARAGVSTTTVSEFLSGRKNACSEETAGRIHAAISELHYTPNSLTRGLRHRNAPTIGVCIRYAPSMLRALRDPYIERLWHGLIRATEETPYSMLLYPGQVRNEADYNTFLDGRVDGLLFSSGYDDLRPLQTSAAGMPTVIINCYTEPLGECGLVYVEEGDTVNLALSHLWELGHRRIAHLTGPVAGAVGVPSEPTGGSSSVAERRMNGYIQWMQAHEAFHPAYLFRGTSWQGIHAEEALACWRQLPDPPTAVFCANDLIATRVLMAAEAGGWRVPETLSVVGVDNEDCSLLVGDRLTTVEIPVEQVGREATDTLLRLIEGAPLEACQVAIPVERLVVRSSTAPLRPLSSYSYR